MTQCSRLNSTSIYYSSSFPLPINYLTWHPWSLRIMRWSDDAIKRFEVASCIIFSKPERKQGKWSHMLMIESSIYTIIISICELDHESKLNYIICLFTYHKSDGKKEGRLFICFPGEWCFDSWSSLTFIDFDMETFEKKKISDQQKKGRLKSLAWSDSQLNNYFN